MDSTEDNKKKTRESFGIFSWATKAVAVGCPLAAVLGAPLTSATTTALTIPTATCYHHSPTIYHHKPYYSKLTTTALTIPTATSATTTAQTATTYSHGNLLPPQTILFPRQLPQPLLFPPHSHLLPPQLTNRNFATTTALYYSHRNFAITIPTATTTALTILLPPTPLNLFPTIPTATTTVLLVFHGNCYYSRNSPYYSHRNLLPITDYSLLPPQPLFIPTATSATTTALTIPTATSATTTALPTYNYSPLLFPIAASPTYSHCNFQHTTANSLLFPPHHHTPLPFPRQLPPQLFNPSRQLLLPPQPLFPLQLTIPTATTTALYYSIPTATCYNQ
ncbi:unnamed protein product [Acanthosepion pharaonis]|uniref:Uncharacterized protein n=1 Tax=Acanthosepion pharaonis TaxID=158019 RepID=A0A812EYU4_ACAPH|nr:unnamed protein product [Sepia pharaonis]